MEDENVVIRKFLDCDDIIIEILLNQIIQFQYTKMNDDLNKVLSSLKRNGDSSQRTAQMAISAVVAIYNAEMSYINVIWDNGKHWWDNDANTRFTIDFKIRFSNCLKDKNLQSSEDWWSRIHILNFKEIIMSV
jgi:hypothetical protein